MQGIPKEDAVDVQDSDGWMGIASFIWNVNRDETPASSSADRIRNDG